MIAIYVKYSLIVAFSSVAIFYILPVLFQKQLPPIVEGICVGECMPVANRMRINMESGVEKGAAFTVIHMGEIIVDLWAGYSDLEAERQWRNDTLTMLFSATKGLAAIVVALMVERGHLNYTKPVAEYWPEFGQNNKQNITVELLLSHQAGLPVLDESISLRDLTTDPEKVERILAEQTTVWPAGKAFGYHGATFGLYVDRLVQKADPEGRDITQIFQQEIADPFELDIYMNSPPELFYKMTRIIPRPTWRKLLDAVTIRQYHPVLFNYLFNRDFLLTRSVEAVKELSNPSSVNNPELKEITVSSFSATATARSLAKLYAILADGGSYKGRQLLSLASVKSLQQILSSGTDQVVMFEENIFGRGTAMRKNPWGQWTFGHPGSGGQASYADPHNNLGIAYLTNLLSSYGIGNDPRFLQLEKETYECLKKYLDRKRTEAQKALLSIMFMILFLIYLYTRGV